MIKFLKSPNLLRRETPEELDRRILLAGALAASRYRRSRRQVFIGALSGIAAALAVAVISVRSIPGPVRETAGKVSAVDAASGAKSEFSERELLEFSDWTTLEQENYNLASQLNCYQDVQDLGISS